MGLKTKRLQKTKCAICAWAISTFSSLTLCSKKSFVILSSVLSLYNER